MENLAMLKQQVRNLNKQKSAENPNLKNAVIVTKE
jgi:hypothetical protein